ncbi:HAD family hydrolase [Selenomonas bovis]|uniref:HAD family hydrolase n=1 Tax=Selenomonas bovis TaxID=416586 RepID=UPI0003667AEE|nr:HAD family hydrolase [Selenomonas bovis]
MANIIAVVWDFDKTLIDGYMETPIFEDNGIDEHQFWGEVNDLPKKYLEEQNVKVNPDTVYMNHLINYVRAGKIKGLNNERLRDYGKRMKFYPGVPDIFQRTKNLIEQNDIYQEYDIKVEHYIVSTGLTEIIRGSRVADYVDGIWGCEFIEKRKEDGERVIDEVGYTIDNTTKTRALFEINKGVGKTPGVSVNTSLPEENRRVHFINMAYIADGPSDIPAFSVVNHHGGATFAIYPPGDMKAMKQVEQMREDRRIGLSPDD